MKSINELRKAGNSEKATNSTALAIELVADYFSFISRSTVKIVSETLTATSHTTVTSYGDCVKMCEDFAQNLRRQKNWLLHDDNAPSPTSFFHKGIFDEQQHNCRFSPTLLFSVSLTENKTERLPF
jgi:hypothetical protein